MRADRLALVGAGHIGVGPLTQKWFDQNQTSRSTKPISAIEGGIDAGSGLVEKILPWRRHLVGLRGFGLGRLVLHRHGIGGARIFRSRAARLPAPALQHHLGLPGVRGNRTPCGFPLRSWAISDSRSGRPWGLRARPGARPADRTRSRRSSPKSSPAWGRSRNRWRASAAPRGSRAMTLLRLMRLNGSVSLSGRPAMLQRVAYVPVRCNPFGAAATGRAKLGPPPETLVSMAGRIAGRAKCARSCPP